MTVAFRASATATNTNGTNGINVTVTKPTGTVNGDLMIAVTHGYTSDTFTAPSGWNFLTFVDDSTGLRSRAYWKIAASEGASYLWTFQPAAGGGSIGVSITSFSGANGIDTWNVQVRSTANPQTGVNLIPSQAAMRYDVVCWRDTVADTNTWSIGTERFDVQAADSGSVIFRGQSGTTHATVNAAGVQLNANSATLSSAPTFGIFWSFAIADTAPANETYASTGIGAELDVNGTWTDISTYIRANSQINIFRGGDSEGGTTNPDRMTMTLENTDGRFTALSPSSPYYPYFIHNIPARAWKASGTVTMQTNGQDGQRYRTPTSDLISIAGDLDIRVDCQPKTWRQEQVLAAEAQYLSDGSGDWVFYIDSDGYPHFAWFDPSNGGFDVKSTLPMPQSPRRQTVRATIDVNNGASGNTVAFYTSDSVTGTFAQLGSSVVTGVVTTINGTGFPPLTIGSVETDASGRPLQMEYNPFRGKIYAAMLKDGIAGTTVANPSFSTQTTGTYVFTDAQGNIWTPTGVVCSNRNYRFNGELSSMPQTWDITGTDVTGSVEFSGPMRRIQQNTPPLRSALYRHYTNRFGIVDSQGTDLEGPYFPLAYWPMEDQAGSTQIAAATSGVQPGKISGAPTLADYDGFVASDSIVNIKSASKITFKTPHGTSGGYVVEFIISAPSGITNGAVIMSIATNGTERKYELSYPSTNNLTLKSFDVDGTQIATSGALPVTIAGALNRISIVGDGTTCSIYVQEQSASANSLLGSISTSAMGRIDSAIINPNGTMTDVYMGHMAIFDGTADLNGLSYSGVPFNQRALGAWNGESAATRAERITEEGGFTYMGVGGRTVSVGLLDSTYKVNGEWMGYQKTQEYFNALRQVEATDGGILHDSRDTLGLVYRTRRSLYNDPATLTLAYDNNELSGIPEGEYDDLHIVNTMTVSRDGGSSSTYEDEDTALNSELPPDGIGPYPDAVSLSLYSDDDALHQAGWKVHLGTVNELRYPSIGVALENARVAASSSLTQAILDTDIGDRLVVTSPPSWLPPYQVTQMVFGYDEVMDKFQHSVTFRTIPEVPYEIGTATPAATSVTQTKTDHLSSTLNADITSSATSIDVAIDNTGGALWTTSGVDFDIVVGGERMTVTSVSGASSPQTFTVTRSVNGVVKAHSDFDPVRLWKRSIAAL